jgi:hypothetical protein
MSRQYMKGASLVAVVAMALGGCGGGGSESHSLVVTPNPLLFCTQVPQTADFTTIASSFGNHLPNVGAVPRGGDLWIRYGDGTLRNLTREAGYGEQGLQGANAIAVREPCVHWSGTKALFSMVVGSPAYGQAETSRWQIYEITGLEPLDTPQITLVPNQPAGFNNVSPVYGSDDAILFTSDRPRNGAAHLYPQLDEYEEAPTVSGVWKLDPQSGALELLEHAPSGAFSLSVDSFGRVIFTRWDHLVRDQQADDDNICSCDQFGTFNYTSEDANATSTGNNDEQFPEPRQQWIDFVNSQMPGYGGEQNGWAPYLVGSEINHFFPWTMNQDGTDEETLNHVGRHELHNYVPYTRYDDPSIVSQLLMGPNTANRHESFNMFQLREDPLEPGSFFATNAPEFFTHGAGQIVRVHGAPSLNASQMTVDWITHPDTANFDFSPSSNHSGMYRNPLPLSSGQWIVSHANTTRPAGNLGSVTHPDPRYKFRLRLLEPAGAYWRARSALTDGIYEHVQYYDPYLLITYDGPLWELYPCEVIARAVPPVPGPSLAAPEQSVLAQKGVTLPQLQAYLRANDLALIISRNVTRRDGNDRQQPYNLRITGTGTETIGGPGTVYDISHLQIFQADLLRGLTMGGPTPIPGRRVLAQPAHDGFGANPPNPGGPASSVPLGSDGSMAALVPAKRALSWQLTDPAGEGVVRERYWITFQPGEVRTCTSCHGLSSMDQTGASEPTNPPEALGTLLQHLLDTGQL